MNIYSPKILCENGCGQTATHKTKGGKNQCASHHRKCPAVLEKGYKTNLEKYGGKTPANNAEVRKKMESTSLDRYGVANASSSAIIKEKRKTVLQERYGVDNPSHIAEVKQKISSKANSRWQKIRQNKSYNHEGLTYDQYRHRVQQYSDTQYHLHKARLDPENLRSKHFHLDHIYSVFEAWMNDVPINVVGDVSNLRMLSDKENYEKHKTSHKSLQQLYEDSSAIFS